MFQVQAEVAAELPSAYLPREHWDTWDPMLISEGLFAGLATKSVFPTNAQSRLASDVIVSWDLQAWRRTPDGVLVSL